MCTTNCVKSKSEFYTIDDDYAVEYLSAPENTNENAVVSFTRSRLHPEVDVSNNNSYLEDFFNSLKSVAADSVAYEDISENVKDDEAARIEDVLRGAAKFSRFDIGEYSNITEYNNALQSPDCDNTFYSVTNLYDLGSQLYYVRFATDNSFYNFAVLRRTNTIDEGYQLLAVRTNSIPLSDVELENIKEAYLHNKLVYKKAAGNIKASAGAAFDFSLLNFKKPFRMPKLINPNYRKPIGLMGGGVCIVMFAFLWIYMASEDE